MNQGLTHDLMRTRVILEGILLPVLAHSSRRPALVHHHWPSNEQRGVRVFEGSGRPPLLARLQDSPHRQPGRFT